MVSWSILIYNQPQWPSDNLSHWHGAHIVPASHRSEKNIELFVNEFAHPSLAYFSCMDWPFIQISCTYDLHILITIVGIVQNRCSNDNKRIERKFIAVLNTHSAYKRAFILHITWFTLSWRLQTQAVWRDFWNPIQWLFVCFIDFIEI